MKFSILIPVYNVELYIARCLDSILAQKIHSYEVILVDDGSTDSSGTICDQYVQQYPLQFRVIHKDNEGLLSARRIGIAHATGEYICFLDSDDFLESNYFEVLTAEFEKYNPDVVVFGYSLVGNSLQILENNHPSLPEGLYERDSKSIVYATLLKDTSINSLCTKCVRRAIIDTDRDYSPLYDVSMGEDLLQSLPILDAATTICIIHSPIYNYYQNEKSITQSRLKIQTINSTVKVLQVVERYALKWNCNKYDIHQRLGLSVVFIIKQLILYRFGKNSYSKEEQCQIIERLKQDDIKAFVKNYDPSSALFSLRFCFLALRKSRYALFRLLLGFFGLLYYCKKYYSSERKKNLS